MANSGNIFPRCVFCSPRCELRRLCQLWADQLFLLRGCINMTRVVSKACETFMKHLEISRTVAHCTLKVQALLQYPKAQPSRCSTWRWFSAWLSVSQCSKHRILGAERSASAHDTAPSWNSSMVTTYWERKVHMA